VDEDRLLLLSSFLLLFFLLMLTGELPGEQRLLLMAVVGGEDEAEEQMDELEDFLLFEVPLDCSYLCCCRRGVIEEDLEKLLSREETSE